ncbi:hypothetical protein KAU33_12765 [Candidatus Dependentiae bacterium]|nr:hypothetical protein [Candidatus Dependentiae bacterium]
MLYKKFTIVFLVTFSLLISPYIVSANSEIKNIVDPNYCYIRGEYLENIHLSNVIVVKDNNLRFNIQNLTRGSIPIIDFYVTYPVHVRITDLPTDSKFITEGKRIKYTGKKILSKTGNIHFYSPYTPVYDGFGVFEISFATQIGITEYNIKKIIPVFFKNGNQILFDQVHAQSRNGKDYYFEIKINKYQDSGKNFEYFKRFYLEVPVAITNVYREFNSDELTPPKQNEKKYNKKLKKYEETILKADGMIRDDIIKLGNKYGILIKKEDIQFRNLFPTTIPITPTYEPPLQGPRPPRTNFGEFTYETLILPTLTTLTLVAWQEYKHGSEFQYEQYLKGNLGAYSNYEDKLKDSDIARGLFYFCLIDLFFAATGNEIITTFILKDTSFSNFSSGFQFGRDRVYYKLNVKF